jgi:phosphotransferase family enzyme
MTEEVLVGGVANAGSVVRVGDEVRRPTTVHTASIHAFLSALTAEGFDGAPVPLGLDGIGRERLVFIDGNVPVPPYPRWAQTDEALSSLATLMGRFHAASARVGSMEGTWSDELADPAGGSIICHNDVCPENVVFRDGRAVGLLDFEFAAPGRPVFDLVQCARMCVPVDDETNAGRLGWGTADRAARTRLFVDAYGLDRAGRRAFFEILSETMSDLGGFVRRRVAAGDENFLAMWNRMGGEQRYDRLRDWWDEQESSFAHALS